MTRGVSIVHDEPVDGAGVASVLASTSTPGVPGGALDELRASFGFLTRLPVGFASFGATGVRAFAVVGAALGLAALLPMTALGDQMPTVAAILAVAVLAVLSGGLHLDGLADTFDALVAVGPDAAERARRDPAIGVAGATALFLVVGLDVAVLAGPLVENGPLFAGLACVVAGTVSRAVPVVLAWLTRSKASDVGMAAWFARAVRRSDPVVTFATVASLALVLGFAVGSAALAVGGLAGFGASVLTGAALVRLRGKLDGDVFGASVELGFAATLLATAAVVTVLPSTT